jgi:putative transposase
MNKKTEVSSSQKTLGRSGSTAFGHCFAKRNYDNGGFSVSQSHVASVVAYIENQEEHHRTMTFEDEFGLSLKRYRIAFDERYLWN